MYPPPSIKKIVQISEESLAPTYVHFVVDNEYYIATQQDMRKIEDVRLISFQKLQQNGNVYPIDLQAVEYLLQVLKRGAANIICITNKSNDVYPQPMDTSPCGAKYSIEEQLKWDRCSNTKQVPFPFTYSKGTSTTDLMVCLEKQTTPKCPKKVSFSCATQTHESITTTTCQDAREQRKQKKLISSYFS